MKLSTYMTFAFVLAASVILGNQVQAQGDFSNSAKWIPESANSIVMIQSEKIFKSKLATEGNWQKEREKAFKAGTAMFPPSMKKVLLASQVDFEFMEQVWSVGVYENGDPINIVDVSKEIGGNIDKIGGKDALDLPNDSYLVQVAKDTAVSMTPANRQLVSRWVRGSEGSTSKVSPYLSKAVEFADANADIIVAFDLDEAISPSEIESRLNDLTGIDKRMVPGYVSSLMAIEGLTLGITVREKIIASVKVDFKESPAALANSGKQILIGALKKNGMMIDDIESFNTSVSGNSLVFSGELSSAGLRQIGSLIRQPLMHDFNDGADVESNMATRTKQYFDSVDHLVNELRGKETKSLSTYAKWFDKYARELDSISVRGVDDDMVAYGEDTANNLRDISASFYGSDMTRSQGVVAEGRRSGYYYDNYYSNRYYDRSNRRRNQNAASALGQQAGEAAAAKIMRQIDADSAAIRKTMTQRYDMDF